MPLPLEPDEALVVSGSENWNPADRELGRERIRPLQAVTADGPETFEQFAHLGVHGIRDIALSGPDTAPVVAFEPDGCELGRWAVPDVEQVWSVRLLQRGELDRLRSCSADGVPT